MQLILRMNLDSAAFVGADDDHGPGPEIARILRELADLVDIGGDLLETSAGSLRDFNGNTCGRWAVGTGSFELAGMLLPTPPAELDRIRELLGGTDWSGVMFDNDLLAAIAETVGVDRQD